MVDALCFLANIVKISIVISLVLLWEPFIFETLEVNRSREVENSEGSHNETFPCVTNHNIRSFETRKAQYKLVICIGPFKFEKI
jgi:hypothetical protein